MKKLVQCRRLLMPLAIVILALAGRAVAYPGTPGAPISPPMIEINGWWGDPADLRRIGCAGTSWPAVANCTCALSLVYTGPATHISSSTEANGAAVQAWWCRYGGNPVWFAWMNLRERSYSLTCPNGGTVDGGYSQCVCDVAWQTDTGTACTRTAGTCPVSGTTGCNKAANDMQAAMPPTNDVRRVFHETLACGIRTACTARCEMDSCKWLNFVSPASTAPYLQNQQPWPSIVAFCNTLRLTLPPVAARYACATAMAERNINHDLTNALATYGCGTDRDWAIIFKVNFSYQSTCLPKNHPLIRKANSVAMDKWRNQTRETCIATRTAAGKDPYLNPELRGQAC